MKARLLGGLGCGVVVRQVIEDPGASSRID